MYVFLTTYHILSLFIEDMSITLKLSRWDSYYKLFWMVDSFFIRCDDNYYILLSSSYILIITKTPFLILRVELKRNWKLTRPCPTCSCRFMCCCWFTQAYLFIIIMELKANVSQMSNFHIHSLSSLSDFFLLLRKTTFSDHIFGSFRTH